MFSLDQSNVQNRLLSALPAKAFEALRPAMVEIDLPLRHTLVEPNEGTSHVCFIEAGLGSVIATSPDNERVEVGHVGREGVTGSHVCLSTDRTPNHTFIQVAGYGIAVPVPVLLAIMDTHPGLRDFFLRYVQSCEIQLAQSALANARYNMHERLARWLLMSHDRMDGSDLPLTHEFLSLMMGVRRSGVTNEIHVLEGLRVIKATRGNIRIIDRPRLEEIAGGCYGVAEGEYERLLGMPIKRPVH